MMNEGELEFCGKVEEQNVSVLLREEAPKPLTIFYRGGDQQLTKEAPHLPTPRLVVKVLAPFRHTTDKAVVTPRPGKVDTWQPPRALE